MFRKLSESFQEKSLGGVIFIYKSLKFYQKKDSTTGASYLGKFLKMDDL